MKDIGYKIKALVHKELLLCIENVAAINKKLAVTGRLTDVKECVRTSYMHKRQDYNRN
jgi:hypothetical protein